MTTSVLAPLRPAARIFTGSTYALLGFDALRAPGARVEQAGPLLAAIRKVVPLPDDDELVVRANAAVQVVCGTMLALGRAQRLSALVLVGSLIPTTLAGHSYWAIEDPAARKIQRIQFHKNLAMIGGLLFALLDEPSPRIQRRVPPVRSSTSSRLRGTQSRVSRLRRPEGGRNTSGGRGRRGAWFGRAARSAGWILAWNSPRSRKRPAWPRLRPGCFS